MPTIKHIDAPDSPAWHARRARCFNAGDAAAMLGCKDSPKTRSELLAELHSGLQREFSDYVQERVINPGHRIEALARPLAEEIIGDDLQVIGGELAVEGLSRPLGASLDGATFLDDTNWECKSANDELRAALPHTGRDSAKRNDPASIPKGKRVQMAQQQMVLGAGRTLFTAAAVDAAGNVTEERHCWYYPEPDLQREILAGWKQLDADLAAYVPPTASAVEKIIAEPVEALPSPVVQVTGQLVLQDNFKVFEARLRTFLAEKLITQPKTDQDFADLDGQIKAMKEARAALKSAEAQMLAQVQPIDQAAKTKKMLDDLLQKACSAAENTLREEKERRRGEIVAGGVTALRDHILGLNKRIGQPFMPASATAVDFNAAIKGMRSLASMEDAVRTAVANAKIAASAIADGIDANLKALPGLVGDRTALTPDLAQLVLKSPDDFAAVVGQRVTVQREQEQRRAEAEAEKAREKIRAEEAAKLRQQQEQEAAAQRQRNEEAARVERERLAALTHPNGAPMFSKTVIKENGDPMMLDADGKRSVFCDLDEGDDRPASTAAAPAPATVHQMPARAAAPAAPAAPPTLTLGSIKELIAPLQITADGMASLGFTGTRERGAVLFHEHQLPSMLAAMVAHLEAIQAKRAA